jgi:hypothetical protein
MTAQVAGILAWEEKSIFQNIPGLSPYKVLTNKN